MCRFADLANQIVKGMMIQPTQRFQAGDRVKLRDGVDSAFTNGFGRVGNEAIIRKRKTDKHGYGQVLVEWDRDHWSYNGTEDQWQWEGHFDLVEHPSTDPGEHTTARPDLCPECDDEALLRHTQANLIAALVDQFTSDIVEVIAAPSQDS